MWTVLGQKKESFIVVADTKTRPIKMQPHMKKPNTRLANV